MKKRIKFSLIVPVYNVPYDYLKHCIDSIMSQDYENFEAIIVDDGSTDDSGKICDELVKDDKRFKLIHQKNKGLCGARNTGEKEAQGEWIFFLDGDDWLPTNALSNLVDATEKSNVDVICFDYASNSSNGESINKHDKLFDENKIYSSAEELKFMKKCILDYTTSCSTTWSRIYRREFLIKNDLYHDEKLRQGAEDIEFAFRVFSKPLKYKFVFKICYHYIFNANSITRKFNENNQYATLNCFNKIRTYIKDEDKELLEYLYKKLYQVIVAASLNGYFSNSNNQSYKDKVRSFNKYIESELYVEALNSNVYKKMDLKRRVIIFLIKNKIYLPLIFISKLKYFLATR